MPLCTSMMQKGDRAQCTPVDDQEKAGAPEMRGKTDYAANSVKSERRWREEGGVKMKKTARLSVPQSGRATAAARQKSVQLIAVGH